MEVAFREATKHADEDEKPLLIGIKAYVQSLIEMQEAAERIASD